MRRKTKRTEENSAGTRYGATAGKTEPEYEEKQGGIPKRQQVRNSEKKQARTPRESRPGTPRKSRPGRRGRAGTDAEEEQARTPRKNRPGRRGKAGPDAEELRESKPGLLKDSDVPLKKNRIGPLKKKHRTKPPTDSGDGKREKHKPGFRKTAEPRTGRTELGPESRQSLSTSVRSRRHPSMRGISP